MLGKQFCVVCSLQSTQIGEIWGISRPCTSFISVTPLHNYPKLLLQYKM